MTYSSLEDQQRLVNRANLSAEARGIPDYSLFFRTYSIFSFFYLSADDSWDTHYTQPNPNGSHR